MATRGRAALTPRPGRSTRALPLVYTAQDVARFCEVDLKTIHHWANAGKILHHRTDGRHLRFRRNDVIRFLRAHGYPLADELTDARPTVFLAGDTGWPLPPEDLAKKLATRFTVRRFESAVAAVAHLLGSEPDAIVAALDDPSWNGAASVAALKRDPTTAWAALVVLAVPVEPSPAPEADLVLAPADLARLPGELARLLAVA